MKALYFDCFSGISGDMSLGALLDLGIDKDMFLAELKELNLDGYEIAIKKSVRNGITGTDVSVILDDEYQSSVKEAVHQHHELICDNLLEDHLHLYEHPHKHGHKHLHDNRHMRGHQHGHHSPKARNLYDIESLIDSSSLKQGVKDFSKKVFCEIARAEAAVHDKSLNDVHFHEVGAVDSIVDIVGVAICLEMLGAETVLSSPLHDGKGFINCQHGLLPVPVPAVMEILKGSGIPLVTEDVNTELVTPTGIGIIKCLSSGFGNMPVMKIEQVGYGMGKRETGRFNALRVVMGTLPD